MYNSFKEFKNNISRKITPLLKMNMADRQKRTPNFI